MPDAPSPAPAASSEGGAPLPGSTAALPTQAAPARRGIFAAFQHRNYRLFFAGQIVSLIGTWMNAAAEGWLVYQLTGSEALLGVVAAASSGAMLFLSTWGGWIADRYSKRNIILLCQVASMVLSFILAFLVWGGHVQPWHIILLAALGGIVMSFDMPARQSFVIEITSREDLTNAISLNSSMVNGARIFGPALAGLIMAKIGIAACFFLDGLSFVAVIASLLLMRIAPRPRAPAEGSALEHALGGFRYVWAHLRVRTIMLLFAVVTIFGWSYSVLMPAFAKGVLGLGESAYGTLLGAAGFGAMLGALTVAATSHRFAPRTMALGGLGIFALMLTAFSFSRSYWVALPLLAGVGFGMTAFFSTSNSAVQTSVPDEMRGRVMGVWALVFGGMMPLGSLQAGYLAQHLGVPTAIAIGAGVCAAAGAVTWWIIQRRLHRRAAEEAGS